MYRGDSRSYLGLPPTLWTMVSCLWVPSALVCAIALASSFAFFASSLFCICFSLWVGWYIFKWFFGLVGNFLELLCHGYLIGRHHRRSLQLYTYSLVFTHCKQSSTKRDALSWTAHRCCPALRRQWWRPWWTTAEIHCLRFRQPIVTKSTKTTKTESSLTFEY